MNYVIQNGQECPFYELRDSKRAGVPVLRTTVVSVLQWPRVAG